MCVCLRVLEQFDSLPGHLTEDLHLFSLSDLSAVRSGEMAPRMKELLKLGTAHVAGCVVRSPRNFFQRGELTRLIFISGIKHDVRDKTFSA